MKKFVFLIFTAVGFLALAHLCTACNVTRRVTTESSYVTKGDTCTVITTKTVETYDAKRNNTVGF